MAKYRMQEMPDMRQTGERKLYPRMEMEGQISTDDLAESISEGSSFTTGDVKGMIAALARQLAFGMRNGMSVKIDGIGIFSASLALDDNLEVEAVGNDVRHNARSIVVRGVNFRADKQLIAMTRSGIRLERATYKNHRSSARYTEEERRQLALDYLKSHPFLTVADYCRLTGLLPTAARNELRRLAADPESGIDTAGIASHRVYVAKKD